MITDELAPPRPVAPPDPERLTEGVRTLRIGRASVVLSERILLVLGGVLAPLGLVLVLLGYLGASQTPYVFEQVSYLISGGLFGLGLVFIGGFLYFAHWLTELLKEQRAQSAAVLSALERLRDDLAQRDAVVIPSNGRKATNGKREAAPRPASLVATAHGTMAHKPDCIVVAGKQGLRRITEADGLAPCKLCMA